MTKNDIQGLAVIPLVFLGCIYHNELADVIGNIISYAICYFD